MTTVEIVAETIKHLPGKHDQKTHGRAGAGATPSRLNTFRLAKRKLITSRRAYKAANDAYEDAATKGVKDGELQKLFDAASSSWEVYADAQKLFDEVRLEKHLPGKHDQSDHGRKKVGNDAWKKVSHTPSQLRLAGARQIAKDEGVSLAEGARRYDTRFKALPVVVGSTRVDYAKSIVEKRIVRRGKQYCVVSKKGKSLGCSPTRAGAAKRLAEVEFFKRKKSLGGDEVFIAKALDAGELVMSVGMASIFKSLFGIKALAGG